MAFILWRHGMDGPVEYVTEMGLQWGSRLFPGSRKYQTRAAAEAAIARRTTAQWQVRETEEAG
jgi:hypothetical protein